MSLDAFYELIAAAQAHRIISMDLILYNSEEMVGADLELLHDPLMIAGMIAGSDETDPVSQATLSVSQTLLADCVTALPEAQREVIVRYYYMGMNQRQTARALGRSPTRVSQIHETALHAISLWMEEHDLCGFFSGSCLL
jgi:RNA polymerase sigma factor (sigma-70 family)